MTNQVLQEKVLDLLESGYTVLAETERFVHQIRRRFRLRRTEEGCKGWEPPKISTLNRWMETAWADAWQEDCPASTFMRWKILRECVDRIPPPEPLPGDVGMIQLLDESFEHCLRYGVDPGTGEEANRLVEWRRQVWRVFNRELGSIGQFHPAQLPEKIVKDLKRHAPRGLVAFVGFEFAGYWENQLLSHLQRTSRAEVLPLPSGEAEPEPRVYSDPEQEITGLVEDLFAAADEHAPHEVAVLLLGAEYGPLLAKALQDLLGEPLSGDRGAYNLVPDRDLASGPLFNAALLPARFALGGERRADLFSLLRSPYYGLFSPRNRLLSSWDRTWRENRIESGIDRLMGSVGESAETVFPKSGSELGEHLAPLLEGGAKPASEWIEALGKIWAAFEFPVLANELDQISWRNLREILSDFGEALGRSAMDAREFVEFLRAAGSRTRLQKSGLEDAGIQICSRLDMRGLVFSKVFVPGLTSGALPQPARPLPLLSAPERTRVLGGTAESQFTFSRHLYGNLLAAAPEIVLSRPVIGGNGDPCLPSPLWPEEREERIEPVIAWKNRLPAMQRARWVRQSIAGVSSGDADPGTGIPPFRIEPPDLRDPVAVSNLRSAMLCPAQFFFRYMLGLDELNEFEPGISPRDRGMTIHAILARFTTAAIPLLKRKDADYPGLAELMRGSVLAELGPRLSEAVWQAESERLIGTDEYPGLLMKLLQDEWARLGEGWTWESVECGFGDARIEGCPARLKGRLDRIDSHPEHGLILWDYKTGAVPARKAIAEDATEPQLPAYVLALSRGYVKKAEPAGAKCGAGYIELVSPGKSGHRVILDPEEENGAFLAGWEDRVADALNAILSGDISPLWAEDGDTCDERCPYKVICGSP
ncbi:MAG: PD-(D/E)XK nuclease family protein [Desulfobacteraceae bacterium]|nr:PD-(D/E)XK nuclease family protein [Desulfobacteraceae bacterium]